MQISYVIRLVLYSVIPLIGILFFGWDWRQVLILYWLENITAGIMTIISMIRAPASSAPSQIQGDDGSSYSVRPELARWAMVAFFCFHYGIFTTVHGVFVSLLTSGVLIGNITTSDGSSEIANLSIVVVSWLIGSLSFIIAQLFKQPNQSFSIRQHMAAPYKRVFALHLALILGISIIMWLQLPSIGALLLIATHAIIDTISRLNNRKPLPATV